jgi:hypothetical protein
MHRALIILIIVLLHRAVLPAVAGTVFEPGEVRALPGGLDSRYVFNSNSPEIVKTEGILLSTFPPQGKRVPEAHLNLPLSGKFEVFSHHINNRTNTGDKKTLFIGLLVFNPGPKKVRVNVVEAASYLSQPDAPFIKLPAYVEDPSGAVYAGPGDRVMSDFLRDRSQPGWPRRLMLRPGQGKMLMNLPVPVRGKVSPVNGRSTLITLRTDGPVYLANIGAFGRTAEDGSERAPTYDEWKQLLDESGVAGPRDRKPTPPRSTPHVVFGRVSGVGQGTVWTARATDDPQGPLRLTIPEPGRQYSYPISTVDHGTFGTGQVQSAPLVVRYPDTAYEAHGNYGIKYDIMLPLYSSSETARRVTVALQSPVKADEAAGGLKFNDPAPDKVFFRGVVRVQYRDDRLRRTVRYVHLVQHQGERGQPLLTLTIGSQKRETVTLSLYYPPDATPPQVVTVRTVAEPQ